jgi:hypothetical protein
MARRRLIPGDRVRFTADHLRSTGQVLGGEGLWRGRVAACPCASCSDPRLSEHVAVDEPSAFDPKILRHVHRDALQLVGELVADRIPQAGYLKRPLG